MSPILPRLKLWAGAIKRGVLALWLAARDPRVPQLAKIVAMVVAAYALSPIDLIPDFIPVLGYLDDLLIVPLGILVAIRLIPSTTLTELRQQAETLESRPVSRVGLMLVFAVWLVLALILLRYFLQS